MRMVGCLPREPHLTERRAGGSGYMKWKKAGLPGEGKMIESAKHTSGIVEDLGCSQ